MILIKDKIEQNKVYFPINTRGFSRNATLVLHSIYRNMDYPFTLDNQGDYLDYFVADVDVNELSDGEYEYTLSSGTFVEKGIVIIGDYKEKRANNKKYNNTIEYKEYNG